MMKRFTLLFFSLLLLTFYGKAQDESKFKALFIVKFSEYIEWPNNKANYTVGVAGNTTVYNELVKFSHQRPHLNIIKIDDAVDAANCDIVFLSRSREKESNTFAREIGRESVLLITDSDQRVYAGSDIGFYLENNRLRFMIKKQNIENKHMIVSSKLLSLGKTI